MNTSRILSAGNRWSKKMPVWPTSKRRGAMVVLIAMMLVILLMTVTFSVDVAYMQLSRTELRVATDAAARAAAEAFSRQQSSSTLSPTIH